MAYWSMVIRAGGRATVGSPLAGACWAYARSTSASKLAAYGMRMQSVPDYGFAGSVFSAAGAAASALLDWTSRTTRRTSKKLT